jgi:ribosomal protein L32
VLKRLQLKNCMSISLPLNQNFLRCKMAVPKKKVSRSRRNQRRFSAAYQLDPVTVVTSAITGDPTRPHRVTLETVRAYVEAKKKHKAEKASKAKNA